MPTVNLAAATAFHILDNREKQFPLIRLFGTLGWITAGIVVSKLLKADTTAMPMRISGIGGVLMGLYSFTLPHIPPSGADKKIYFQGCDWSGCFFKIKIEVICYFHHQPAVD